MALFEGAQMAVHLRRLLEHLGKPIPTPTTLYEDNAAAIVVAVAHSNSTASRHIKVKYHWTREQIEEQEIEIVKIGTGEQLADGLTKNLPFARLAEIRTTLMA
jgi:p-aminobenzoyl-glutamate transporter AbgT